MSDKSKTRDTSNGGQERSPQVGALLRASRLRVGEELRPISEVLCIRYLYLEAIEACRYGDLPGDTYAVGFIRSYAEHLGLDGEEVVRRYRAEQAGSKRSNDLSFPTPVPDSGMPKGAIVFVGVILALVIYGGWYVTTTDESILSNLISPVPDHLKHLVTGSDQPADDAATAESGATTTASESGMSAPNSGTPAEVEQAVRDNVNATGEASVDSVEEAAQQTANAASDAAASAAAAVTPSANVQPSTAATIAEPVPVVPAPTAPVQAPPSSVITAPEPAKTPTQKPVPAQKPATVPAQSAPAPASTPAAAPEPKPANGAVTAAPESSSTTEAPTPPADAPTESEAPAAPTSPEASPVETVTAEDLNARSLKQATEARTATAAASTQAATVASPIDKMMPIPASGIVIRASDSSWVEVRDPASGRIIFTGLLSPDATIDVPKISGLLLDTGNAGALEIYVEGVPVPKLGGVGSVRKGVALDAERLKAGTAVNR